MPNETAGGARTGTAFEATVKRARALLDAGRLREAFDTLGSLRLTASQSPEVAYLRIGVAMQMEDWSAACARLDELVKIVPNRAVIHLDRISHQGSSRGGGDGRGYKARLLRAPET